MACKGLDAQVAHPDDPELAALINRFVPLRLLNMKEVDLNIFRFDYDLTFAVLMLDADGRVYSRFGSRDGESATDRMSVAGLKRAMREVLRRHAERPAGVPEAPRAAKKSTIEDLPSFKKSRAAAGYCYHCHFVQHYRFRDLLAEGRFSREMLFRFPLPENIGLTLDTDSNNVVKAVAAGSPAAKIGLAPGDVLVSLNALPILTSADLQFALNGVADPGTAKLEVERAGQRLPPRDLELPSGWRRVDIGWRASLDAVPPSLGIWGESVKEADRKELDLPGDRLALRITFLFPEPRWARTRGDLRMGDILLGWNGQRPESMGIRQLHAWWRLNFKVGDRVTLDVLRGKRRVEVPVECVDAAAE